MIRCFVLFLSCCLLPSALAQPAAAVKPIDVVVESSPARQALDAWLEAFNANDRQQLEAFRDRYQPTMNVDGMLDFHKRTGGFRLIRREPSDPDSAQALLQELDSDTIARIQITLKPDAALALRVEVIEPPQDLRIPRLDQDAAVQALKARADAQAQQDAFSGVLLVAHGDEPLLQHAWGIAEREAGTPVTLETKFRLGSMNKMFTAVATLQLVQAGTLALDGTVGRYLPDYPNQEVAQVTIRQLLTHSGGTGDIFGPQFDAQRLSLKTHADYVRLYGARAPEHVPGEAHRYSNYGFLLLGAIIERVSGQSYYDYVDEHVFTPAGMRDTGSLPEDMAVPGRAVAYTRGDDGTSWRDAADTLPYRGTAAGGGYSTAGDLLKFARALQSGKLLSPTLVDEATRRQSPWYGYGFAVAEEQGVPWYGHGGGAQGMNGELRIFPTLGMVVIGLGNVDPPAVSRLVEYYQVRMPLVSSMASLRGLVRAYAEKNEFSGTVLVRHGDEVLAHEAIGIIDHAFDVPATLDTRYRIASITKLFTATLVLQLADEGRIDIAAPVSRYLPHYRTGDKIPVRTLLNHTSGLPNPDADVTFDHAVSQGMPMYQLPHDTDALLRDYASGPPKHEPGSRFDYNNADYIVLGKLIEAVTGESFEAALHQRILSPLCLNDSGMLRQRDVVNRLASTYLRLDGAQTLVNDLPVLIENWYAAGAMYSTTGDLARFADALYGGRLLKPETLAKMLTPGLDEYGYGLWVWDQKGDGRPFRAAVRFGSIMGANGVLYRILSDDMTIVVLGNTNTTDSGAFADHLARAALHWKDTLTSNHAR